jgi:hypothetical protein
MCVASTELLFVASESASKLRHIARCKTSVSKAHASVTIVTLSSCKNVSLVLCCGEARF